ncbi:MAG: diadenosine tetraphosphatase, partial [Gammaproteobacteria bacterium]|nr:diadenosine tetraphosphatase [Gammaproteobacteria bacterium]
ESLVPWYTLRNDKPGQHNIFFGHWSTLGLSNENGAYCLDTGCLWGGTLTALKIDDSFTYYQIDCKGEQQPF